MDVISLALDHAVKVSQLRKKKGEKKSGFTRRADNFPSLMASVGMVPAVTFYMSKAEEGLYERAYAFLSGGPGNGLEKEVSEEESTGYSLYLACLAKVLDEIRKEERIQCDEPKDLVKLAELLKKIRDEKKSFVAEKILQEYSMQLKKLADALVG